MAAADPLFTLGARRTAETLTEILIPMGITGYVLWAAKRFLDTPSVSRPLTDVELAVVLGALVCVVSWYGARQLYVMGTRRPLRLVSFGWLLSAACVAIMAHSVKVGFTNTCTDLGGMTLDAQPLLGEFTRVCQIRPVAGNPYLPGTLLRPTWAGNFTVPLALWLAALSMLTTLGLRSLRLRPSRMGLHIAELLHLAPASGSAGISGEKPADGAIQACANPTMWGELCGQTYAAEREFEDGEWCVRCSQVYRRAERELRFKVVSLFTADIDVLNGLERLDALVWPQGEAIPPDARLSGQERWVQLGTFTAPDVITVSTLLALVHEQLGSWGKDADEPTLEALQLAQKRASRIAAWIWFGEHSRDLTFARPTHRALLAHGPSRLRDLMLDVGEDLVLQLDIGFLPLELRTGYWQSFLDEKRAPMLRNSKQDVWVPVAGKVVGTDGMWIPRIEGEALRSWLALDRLRPVGTRGVSSPLPYVPVGGEAADPRTVRAGSIDLIRTPLDVQGHEVVPLHQIGQSLSEWTWMPWQLIELLRQESLVMVAE